MEGVKDRSVISCRKRGERMKDLIMIVEDEKKIASALQYAFNKEGYDTICVYRGDQAIRTFSDRAPSVVLLDLMLPGQSGMEVLRHLRGISNVGIICLTAKNELVDKVVGLELGADDYITKPFDIREVITRVKVLIRRLDEQQEDSGSQVTPYKDMVIYTSQHRVKVFDRIIQLTPKEYDLLLLLCENKEEVYSRESLLDGIWGLEYTGGTRTVDIHIQRIRKKLPPPYDCIIQTVYGVGYYAMGGYEL